MATILVELLANSTQFKADLDKAVASTEKANSSFAKMGKVAGVVGVALAGGLAFGLTKSVDAASKFQSSMELIQTQAGASTMEVKNMSKALVDMAASVGSTPETLSQGLYHIESAGYRGAKALSILKLAAEGAAVGHSDLEQTTTALVAAERTGIKGLGDMSHAMGTLNAIVGAGNMRMDDLTSALGTGVLVSAKAFGLSIKDVGGALATMTSNGIPAVNAASGLKMLFASLAAPTKAAAKSLASIGLTSTELAQTMRSKGLGAALMELQAHLKGAGLNATETAALLTSAFGKKSSTGLLTLIGNLGAVKTATDQISTGASTFGKNWEETQASSEFRTKQFHAAVAALEVELGTALLPALTSITSAFASGASFLVQHKVLTEGLVAAVGALAAILITVSVATKLQAAYTTLVTAATKVWAAAQWLLNAALDANPIGIVIVAIAALVAGVILAYQHSATFRSIVTGALNAVTTAANAVLDFFRNNWPLIATLISGPFAPIVLLATNAFGVRDALTGAFQDVKDWLGNHWQEIATIISGPFAPIVALATNAFGIRDALTGALNDMKTTISTWLTTVVTWIGGLPTRILNALGDTSHLLVDAGVAIITGLITGMKSKLKDLKSFATGIAGDLTNWKGPIEYDRVLLVPQGQAIMQGLQAGMESGLGSLKTMTSGIAPSISANIGSSPVSAPTGSGGGGGHTFNFYGWVADKQAVVEAIRSELIRTGMNTTGGALGGFG